MKKTLLLILVGILSSCGYSRLGDLTMASNRNIDPAKDYVLIAKNTEAIVKTKHGDPLERAIDACTDMKNGDYLMNVKIYMKKNGRKLKVIGDVYGIPTTNVNVNTKIDEEITFKIGDRVAFSLNEKVTKGKIIGLNANGAIIEYKTFFGTRSKHLEVTFIEITKLDTEKAEQ